MSAITNHCWQSIFSFDELAKPSLKRRYNVTQRSRNEAAPFARRETEIRDPQIRGARRTTNRIRWSTTDAFYAAAVGVVPSRERIPNGKTPECQRKLPSRGKLAHVRWSILVQPQNAVAPRWQTHAWFGIVAMRYNCCTLPWQRAPVIVVWS